MYVCMYVYVCIYEAGAHMAEETRDARRGAPRGIMGTVCMCVCMYVYVCIYEVGAHMAGETRDVMLEEAPLEVRYVCVYVYVCMYGRMRTWLEKHVM
jgi:hypothetical protein